MLVLLLFVLASADYTFLSIGDWGGITKDPYYTDDQAANNHGMTLVATEKGVDMILAVGDNYYSYGVDEDDVVTRFQESWDNVYTGAALQASTWYACAGNHDWRGDVQAQIDMMDIFDNWYYPDYWYKVQKKFDVDGQTMVADFLFIDTVVLTGDSYHDEEKDIFVKATGPANKKQADEQFTWIKDQLQSSTADYVWVIGHYPVWSVCSHGPDRWLVDNLKQVLEDNKVTGYIAGHDHCSSFIDEGKGVVYPLAGMGVECCYKDSNYKSVKKTIGKESILWYFDSNAQKQMKKDGLDYPVSGFASYTMGKSYAEIVFYDHNGNELYTAPPVPKREVD